jgi:hypothetical protein
VSRKPRSGTATFRPRARLLKLIGEELISDDVVAVAELVKNAHDADAHTVTISFRGVTTPEGEIEIRDDGVGMDLEALLWEVDAARGNHQDHHQPQDHCAGEEGAGREGCRAIRGRQAGPWPRTPLPLPREPRRDPGGRRLGSVC